MSFVVDRFVTEDANDELTIDGLDLPAGAELEGVGGDAVGVSQASLRVLVDKRERVRIEDLALAAGVA